jgi:hypothetical protein
MSGDPSRCARNFDPFEREEMNHKKATVKSVRRSRNVRLCDPSDQEQIEDVLRRLQKLRFIELGLGFGIPPCCILFWVFNLRFATNHDTFVPELEGTVEEYFKRSHIPENQLDGGVTYIRCPECVAADRVAFVHGCDNHGNRRYCTICGHDKLEGTFREDKIMAR